MTTKPKKLKLLPCPFCGSKRVLVTNPTMWQAWCMDCKAIGKPSLTKQDAIEAWNTRAPGWIPCSERLPELMQYVLCLLVSGEYRVMRRESTNYWQTDFKHPYRGDIITHWMPLPEPKEMNV